MYDDNGQALFYVVLTQIGSVNYAYFYDKNGTIWQEKVLGNLSLSTNSFPSSNLVSAREIPIISIGCGRYHAVLGNEVIQINIADNTWERLIINNNPLSVLNIYGFSGSNYLTSATEIGSVLQLPTKFIR